MRVNNTKLIWKSTTHGFEVFHALHFIYVHYMYVVCSEMWIRGVIYSERRFV